MRVPTSTICLRWIYARRSVVLLSTKRCKSYHHTIGEIPQTAWTCGDILNRAAALKPDHMAVVSVEQNIRKTYFEYKNDVDKTSRGLLSLGLSKGAMIAILAPNIYEWLLLQYATAKAGFILVNINTSAQEREIEYVLKKARCEAIVISERMTPDQEAHYYSTLIQMIPEMLSTPTNSNIQSKRLPHLKKVITISDTELKGTISLDRLCEEANTRSEIQKLLEEIEPTVDSDNPVNVQFTSGTTGQPKGALLTHSNMLNNALLTCRHMRMHLSDVKICLNVPLFHTFGCVIGSLASVIYQGTLVLPSMRYSPLKSLKAIEKERCTFFYGTPTMYIDIAAQQEVEKRDVTSLNSGVMGGAPAPAQVIKNSMNVLHIEDLYVVYGCTETGPVISITQSKSQAPDGSWVKHPVEEWVHTIGKPNSHVEVKIIDPQTKLIVPHGNRGELCARGYLICLGYLHDVEETAKAFEKSGWYHTGDEATMESDGTLIISGRIKDMIIRGGENVYPLEIENVLFDHPAVEEIQVCGVPDARLGEEVCAWVLLKRDATVTEEELKQFCQGKLSAFKIPRYWFFVDSFPKTTSGKIQKYVMRQKSAEKLNL